jgi:hypothetical protein
VDLTFGERERAEREGLRERERVKERVKDDCRERERERKPACPPRGLEWLDISLTTARDPHGCLGEEKG